MSLAGKGLTPKQHELLTYIKDYVVENDGVSPSYREMKDAVGLRSKAGIARIVRALDERGFIRRLPDRARSIFPVSGADRTNISVELSDDQMYQLRHLARRRGQSPEAVARNFVILGIAIT